MSEIVHFRHLVVSYCSGNGIDIGSQGDPVVPWAIQMDLPNDQFLQYNSQNPPAGYIHWRSSAVEDLPFKDGVLDFVFSSHLIEDFEDWEPILMEWVRVIKPGGHLIVAVPDKVRFAEAIAKGQPPNCAHKHESHVGELTEHATRIGGLKVVTDGFTNCRGPDDYNILFVGRKL